MKVVMSSGHGLKIRGAAGPSPWGLDEVNEARKVVEQTAVVLRSMGVETKTWHDDKSTTQDQNLAAIVSAHNSSGPHDLDVSIHFNAYEVTTTKAMGVECCWISTKDLSAKVSAAMAKAAVLPDRGPKERTELYFLRHTNAPAILVETLFCDAKIDCDSYRQNFNAICSALPKPFLERKRSREVPPEKPPITTPPLDEGRMMISKGDTGPDVVQLQKALGVLVADGDFGSTTDTWVKAFQAASGLMADGIVGNTTWDEVDDLVERVETGKPRLRNKLVEQIWTMAATSEIADYAWPDRGIAPTGYIAGIALCFAYAVRRGDDDDAVNVMSQAQGNADKDALAWYAQEFASLGMSNKKAGVDTLRHLFVMTMGLGMRESSGRYCEGRDLSASNVEADTCEAGLFQTSWNIRSGSPAIEPMIDDFWENPNGFLTQFKEGLTATANNLNSYGSGDGVRYQFLSRFAPLFHVMVTGVGMRVLRQHWGPINRREVTLRKEADELLKDVQELMSATV